jgi:hypothetical protein
MADYLGPTASLIESTAKTNTNAAQLKGQKEMQTEQMLTSSANAAGAQADANQRADKQSKQAQLLETLKAQASLALEGLKADEAAKLKMKELKAQSDLRHQQDYFTVTPEYAHGVKSSVGMDISDMIGKETHAGLLTALIINATKENVAKIVATARGKSPEDLQKELLKEQQAIKGNRDKLMTLTSKDLPDEAWGGEPGNIAKAVQFISAGKFGKLDANQQRQVQYVAGTINTMKAQQNRANELHRALGTQAEDYTGMGLTSLPSGNSTTPPPAGNNATDDQETIQVRTSDGTVHTILKKNLSIAQQRDPKLQVVGPNPTKLRS